MPKEKSAGAIIFIKENSKNYYLLLHSAPSGPGKKGHWGFAKGHIEEGETEEETTRREIAEETGIGDLKIIMGFKELEKYFFRKVYGLKEEEKKKAPWIFKTVIFFLAETKTKEVKISEEHDGFVWLAFEDALKKLTYKNAKELLKRADGLLETKFK
jgi:8-oxo-dGTP pyrophosphatase MutT (NUDIX family)